MGKSNKGIKYDDVMYKLCLQLVKELAKVLVERREKVAVSSLREPWSYPTSASERAM